MLDFLKTNRVPDLFVASGSRSWNQPDKYPGTFGFSPTTRSRARSSATTSKTNLAGKKVCFLGQDDDFGRDSLAGVEKVPRRRAVAAKQTYVTSNPNVGPQIGAFKAAGCQVVMLATVPGFTALSHRHRREARLQAAVAWSPTSAPTTRPWPSSSAPPRRCSRAWSAPTTCRCRHDAANPWIQLFKKVNKEYNGDAPFDGNIVYGMSVGYLFVQALLAAGKDLTREKAARRRAEGRLHRAPGSCRCASPPTTTPGTAGSG